MVYLWMERAILGNEEESGEKPVNFQCVKRQAEGEGDQPVPNLRHHGSWSNGTGSKCGKLLKRGLCISALRSLLRSNPGLNIPQEIATALEDNTNGMTQDAKSELMQKHLNMRRKATQRIERLEAALQRKKLQVAAFQEQLKKQLKQDLY